MIECLRHYEKRVSKYIDHNPVCATQRQNLKLHNHMIATKRKMKKLNYLMMMTEKPE